VQVEELARKIRPLAYHYVRMNRWNKAGVLSNVFRKLQLEHVLRVNVQMVALDSTHINVHPDGTEALKKGPRPSAFPEADARSQTSFGCRRCQVRPDLHPFAGKHPRRPGMKRPVENITLPTSALPTFGG
jgi:hypothetical protein